MKMPRSASLSLILATPLLIVALWAHPAVAQLQPAAAETDSADVRYYDRWPGSWYRVVGDTLETVPTFRVRRGPGHSFLEEWRLVIDGKPAPSFGLRAWDPPSHSWRLVWVADPDHFQLWDGEKRADGWYITRTFGTGASAFLSRQAWLLQPGEDKLVRTIERSTDGGRTWTVRSRETFRRGAEAK